MNGTKKLDALLRRHASHLGASDATSQYQPLENDILIRSALLGRTIQSKSENGDVWQDIESTRAAISEMVNEPLRIFRMKPAVDRTFACTQACMGLDTVLLISIVEEGETLESVVYQRNELLEVLQDIVLQYEKSSFPIGADLADSIRVFGKAAIAKATGEDA